MREKITAQVLDKGINDDGTFRVVLNITDLPSKVATDSLSVGKEYAFDVSLPKKTVSQNAFFWSIMSLIAEKYGSDKMSIYRQLLVAAGVNYSVVEAPSGMADELRTQYRYVEYIGIASREAGTVNFGCFGGISRYDKEEMSRLIDIALEWCAQLDIPVEQNEWTSY